MAQAVNHYEYPTLEPKPRAVDLDIARPIHYLLSIWMICCILFGNNFCYVKLAGVYVNELMLLILFIEALPTFEVRDYVFLLICGGYLLVGCLMHGSFFFASKDLTILYYLLFLRCFPKDMPATFIKWLVVACLVHALLVCIGYQDDYFSIRKYRTAVILTFLFVLGVFRTSIGNSKLFFASMLFVAYRSDFKAMIIFFLIYFLHKRSMYFSASLFTFKRLMLMSSAVIFLVFVGMSDTVLAAAVEALNQVLGILGVNQTYGLDTSIWRARIWRGSILVANQGWDFFFGDFPGRNFISNKYLNLGRFIESGGESLGVNRYVHSFVLQIFTKTGFFGILIYFYYLTKSIKYVPIEAACFFVSIFFMNQSSAILELPEAGPIAYCLVAFLCQTAKTQPTEQGLRSSIRRTARP